ncbi:hypothetical protein RHGRI_025572 [Rhododendron griersonianum]|uniref:Uncharacterized protein n=1 Tax=Rhododendron griersonianum TaxID=479676 RepID=A0AAV6IRY2_9ERIC|nr:hypothetical protein RHGRI_025572 [Rhododendron griersonianum]
MPNHSRNMSSSISVLWTAGCDMEFPKGSWSGSKEIGGLNSAKSGLIAPSSRESEASVGPLRKLMLSPSEDCFGQWSGPSRR